MSRTRAVITVVATCAVITVAYFATIPILYASDGLFGGPISTPVMAIPMVVVPYVLGGIVFGLLASRHTLDFCTSFELGGGDPGPRQDHCLC